MTPCTFMKQSVRYLGVVPNHAKVNKLLVEAAARVAYKSNHYLGMDGDNLIKTLLKKGHHSVFEHSNIVIMSAENPRQLNPKYFTISTEMGYVRIAGSIRAWFDARNTIPEAMYALLSREYPEFFPDLYETSIRRGDPVTLPATTQHDDEVLHVFHIICDRGISHEIVRHRTLQFTQESTRYVNYTNKGFQFIIPQEYETNFDFDKQVIIYLDTKGSDYLLALMNHCQSSALLYERLILKGYRPQAVRDVLPHTTKTEIVVSGRLPAFQHFIELRRTKDAHPRIREIAQTIETILSLTTRKYISETSIVDILAGGRRENGMDA